MPVHLKPSSRKGAKVAKEVKIYRKRPETWWLKALQGFTLRTLRALRETVVRVNSEKLF